MDKLEIGKQVVVFYDPLNPSRLVKSEAGGLPEMCYPAARKFLIIL